MDDGPSDGRATSDGGATGDERPPPDEATTTGGEGRSDDVNDRPWRELFGHADPYPEQVDGIETAVETARESGFTVLEGACGTGKTMLALVAGIHLVRDPDSPFERVLVLTSVKQQLRQFEADLRAINAGLPEEWAPVSGLTLVGKADVCPYEREGAGGFTEASVYDRCETLRDRTRDLTGEGGVTTAASLAADARNHQTGLATSADTGGSLRLLETAGETASYAPEMPEYDDGGGATEYCPFYAQYLADLPEEGDPAEAVPFDLTEEGLVTPEELIALSVRAGTCPHSIMGVLVPHAEVVIGNYYHAFDPTTVAAFTGALLDESTFLVCDEAHMLEPRVRDLVSDGVSDATLRDAEGELTRVIQPVRFDERGGQLSAGGQTVGGIDADLVRAELGDTQVTLDELEEFRSFVRALREELDRRVTAFLDAEHRGWRGNLTDLPDAEIPLRDPETPRKDELTEWAEKEGFTGATWVRAEAVGAVVARILNAADDEERTRAVPSVGRVLGEWYRHDHTDYFREVELERTWNDTEPPNAWRRAYTARLSIFNCVPSDAIAERLAEFGGGVLMSATLAPLDVFAEVTGLRRLNSREGRPVVERTYGLNFPAERRESFAVAAPKFTYDNRGSPQEENATRQCYADAICAVAHSPGNVLVGMPSYGEATWAAGVLEECVDKPVLLDESSDDVATEALKDEFFDGEGKVLVTSLRGTLTEGVDYRGDRLAAAVVCGVPIVNTASPRTRAIRTAYDRAFGDGFTYALTIPAVRKARQAIGRVIRGPEEIGARVLLDERYARESWDSVRGFLPDADEFQPVSPDMLELGLERFWSKW